MPERRPERHRSRLDDLKGGLVSFAIEALVVVVAIVAAVAIAATVLALI